ncbi:MAG: tetratricopeptide repeat protein [Magnetococcus sp. WYHC-3]
MSPSAMAWNRVPPPQLPELQTTGLLASAAAINQAEVARLLAALQRMLLPHPSHAETPSEEDQGSERDTSPARATLEAAPSAPLPHWRQLLERRQQNQEPVDDQEAICRQGMELCKKGRYAAARERLDQVFRARGMNRDGALHLGYANTRLGHLDDAIQVLAPFHQHNPLDVAVATLLGKAYLLQGHPEQAVNIMSPAARINPERFHIHFYLGIALAKQGRIDEARSAWRQALSVRNDHDETRRFLARAEMLLARR